MAKKTTKDNTVKIGKAKGRPMLTWVGKKPLTTVRAYPAQHVVPIKGSVGLNIA